MTSSGDAGRAEEVRGRYRRVFGDVPAGIEDRLRLAEATGRLEAIEAIEALRHALLADNPLEPRVQQLVHFAQLVALGREGPARLHAQGALRSGATLADLVGVAETSLVTSGMPAYGLAVDIIAALDGALTQADPPVTGQSAQDTPASPAVQNSNQPAWSPT